MTKLATHVPWGVLLIGLTVEVIGPNMEPVEVAINVEILEIPELIHRMVLQVVVLCHKNIGKKSNGA